MLTTCPFDVQTLGYERLLTNVERKLSSCLAKRGEPNRVIVADDVGCRVIAERGPRRSRFVGFFSCAVSDFDVVH